ncbi:LacI family DNA-binding transcriptional regulator [Companilactobacillus nuruki]|uniref:LacI family transcriptional regulator n=1 Tax=Companilactobacillus nuruki TaxID=1993540 RepID=A0A2N7ARF0_9LACO|nr:LacI family DNA-binding transcriptional regulator [Companilactobacillus nuruki]PMD67924.1 LacI family transcriptional regulator [Companilactobacillus nuruki]
MATIKEIAKKAGVGVGTVSRYLNNHPYVSDDKRIKIKKAIDELNYTPSAIATQLRSNSTKNIGVLVSRFANPFFAELFDAIERKLNQFGYQVLVSQTHDDSAAEQRFLDQLKNKQVDGVILASVENHQLVEKFAKSYPNKIVLLNEENKDNNIPSIVLNHYQATMNGLEYLYQKGHRNFSYITGGDYDNKHHGYSRTKAFQDFLKTHQLSINNKWVFSQQHTALDGQKIAQDLMIDSRKLPDAVFTNSDEVAIGLINELQKNGIHVPKDIAIVGYDDQPFARFAEVPLTTIRQPINAMANKAVDILLKNLTDSNIDENITEQDLKLKLIIRKSA